MTKIATFLIPLAVLAGCTKGTAGSEAPTEPAPALAAALARVPAAALGAKGDFEFGRTAKLASLQTSDKTTWQPLIYVGGGAIGNLDTRLKSAVGVDLAVASTILSVGTPPASMTLVVGGQDRAGIEAAAKKSGWTGTDLLTKPLNLSDGDQDAALVSISAPKIRPLASDVVLGGPSSDPKAVDTGSAADKVPAVTALRNCLQDVIAAQATGVNTGAVTAVGTRVDGSGSPSTVICLGAPDEAAATALSAKVKSQIASGVSARSGRKWSAMLPSAAVDTLAGQPAFVRIVTSSPEVRVTTAYQMLAARDLPN